MKLDQIEQLLQRMESADKRSVRPTSEYKKEAGQLDGFRSRVPEVQKRRVIDPEEEDFVPVGVGGLLSASEKLLAINKGIDKPDERDSLVFKRFMTTDKLLSERIKLDNNKVRQRMIPTIAKQRSLEKLYPFALDNYMEGYLLGNPLTSPLEEINPLHLVEQSRRVTQMGPGGIGSENAITEDMQAVRTDQFGFLSTLEGPETFDKEHWLLTVTGWKPVHTITSHDKLACNLGGRLEFHHPIKLHKYHYNGTMILAEHSNIRMCVTPNHRVVSSKKPATMWSQYKIHLAQDVIGKTICVPCWHLPYRSKQENKRTIKVYGKSFDIVDFASWLGWYLSEGDVSSDYKQFRVSQCGLVNKAQLNEICDLYRRLGVSFSIRRYSPQRADKQLAESGVASSDASLLSFIKNDIPGGRLCQDKGFPLLALDWPINARHALLDSLLKGDGRVNSSHTVYCSTSRALAEGVELLMISLGHPTRFRKEVDKRDHVKTTNWCACQLRIKEKTITSRSSSHKNYPGRTYGKNWASIDYNDYVYSVSVPGGLVFTKGSEHTQGYWSGNSERIGIDTRMAWGTRIGSDGRPYQIFYDRKAGKHRWLSPEDLDGKVVKLPD